MNPGLFPYPAGVASGGGSSLAYPTLWVSRMVVAKGAFVQSPLDFEIYCRKTATGGGTTDPADDTTNYFAVSFERPGSIVNRWSAGAAADQYSYSEFETTSSNLTLSAAARTQVLSLSGKGAVTTIGIVQNQISQARTVRLELIVDGRTIFDATNAYASVTESQYVFAVGFPIRDPGGSTARVDSIREQKICFARSATVWVTSSVAASGTNLVLRSNYEVRT